MILLPVLHKCEDYKQMIDKLYEEIEEFIEAIDEYETNPTNKNKLHIEEELFDMQQVLVGIFEKHFRRQNENMREASYRHLFKMIDRKWSLKELLHIKSIREVGK